MNHLEMPKLAGVYKITNLVNGKVYIGKSWNIRRRLSQHICSSRSSKADRLEYIHKAIKKYEVSSFRVDVLEVFPGPGKTFDWLLLEREAFWIKIYDSCNVAKGYNLSEYGASKLNYEVSEETRRKMSKSNKGRVISESTRKLKSLAWMGDKNPNYGKPMSENTRKKLSEANKGRVTSEEVKKKISEATKGKRTGQDSHKFGVKNSEETRRKIREASTNTFKKSPSAKENFLSFSKKAILKINVETNEVLEEFSSIKEAAIKLAGDEKMKKYICDCLHGKSVTAFGFLWKFKNPETSLKRKKVLKTFKVNQIDPITGEVIKKWNSISDAAKEFGVTRHAIYRCLTGKSKTSAGFIWRKLEKSY